MNRRDPGQNERGVALVMALLVLLVLSLLSAALMMSVNTETLIAGHSQRETQALNTAEAGLAEAAARLRVGDIPNNMNPNMVAQIFNALPGSVPVLGVDSVALATAQPAGQWLDYSTATRGPDVLTVQYRKDPATGQILKYDPTMNPRIQTTKGSSIFIITSTGYQGKDVRRLQEEVIQKPFNVNVKSALAADVGIIFQGNSYTCGHDHDWQTPAYTRDAACIPWETGPEPTLPGGWSSNNITKQGSSSQRGNPDPPGYVDSQIGFYAGPWEALGMTQAEFLQWIGSPVSVPPYPPRGVYYLDNNTTLGDQSGSFSYSGGDGEGMLYVDGDLTVNGNFTYRGLIYVEGNTDITGTFWCLGGMIVRGRTVIRHASGDATILYSSEAIQQSLQKYGGTLVAISWKEL